MRKALIIHGPQQSGKSKLARKLMKTAKNPVEVLYHDFDTTMKYGLPVDTDMIIVEACPTDTDWEKFYNYIGSENSPVFVFVTQSHVFPLGTSFDRRFELISMPRRADA